MAKITREAQKIFASASNTNEKAVFGSMKTGNPVYTTDLATLQSNDYEQGWQNGLLVGKAPFLEEMNGVQYGLSKQIAYMLQDGIPEWLESETYYKDNYCKVGHDIFYSNSDDNTGNNPTTDNVNWTHAGNYDTATSTTSGITKLYSETGDNTDGTMTQLAITSALPSQATSSELGTVKLYTTTGANTDGTMTQTAITTALNGKQATLTAGENITIVDNVISATGGGEGGSVAWGDITGTLASQTDLGNALGRYMYKAGDYYNGSITGTSGTVTINLGSSSTIYYFVPSGACTFTFDASGTDSAGVSLSQYEYLTFELGINMTSAVRSLTFPSSVVWMNGTAPDLSSTGVYYLVFRKRKGHATWIGNLQGTWSGD